MLKSSVLRALIAAISIVSGTGAMAQATGTKEGKSGVGPASTDAAVAAELHELTFTVRLSAVESSDNPTMEPHLGIGLADEALPFLNAFAMPPGSGALVSQVFENSTAETAGVQPGDFITSLDGHPVVFRSDLHAAVAATPAGTPVSLGILRYGDGLTDFLRQIKRRVAEGDDDALTAMGERAFWGGFGLENYDSEAAFGFYGQAAEQGNALAAVRLGRIYYYGDGAPADGVEATRWFQTAHDLGDPGAPYWLGLLIWNGEYWNGSEYVFDDPLAMSYFQQAGENSDSRAYWYLGYGYRYGAGVEQDPAQAVTWFQRSLDERGDADSYASLGELYYLGEGVKTNYDEARQLMETGIDFGSNFSYTRYYLAFIYQDGLGSTSADDVRADQLFRQAAEDGNTDAMYAIAYRLTQPGASNGAIEAAKFMYDAIALDAEIAVTEMTTNADAWPDPFRREFQRLLNEGGFYSGRIDGDFGPGTTRAVEALAATAN
jgi:hypothetical protein